MEWNLLIEQELKKPYFQELVTFLKKEDQERLILPPKEKRLSSLKLTPFETVKVVILGQDPYHDIGQAHGLAFSVETGAYPPSLKNIYKELIDDLKIPYPKTGNLTQWATQGVLLLNTCLTVVAHQALSHQGKGWEIFTSEVIKEINLKSTCVVFILWGAHAQKMKTFITNPIHRIITSPHPSPLSASRGFFGSKPFSKANAYLMASNITPIDWNLH
jgi:uracil-DNA glycosylase